MPLTRNALKLLGIKVAEIPVYVLITSNSFIGYTLILSVVNLGSCEGKPPQILPLIVDLVIHIVDYMKIGD